jgi:photosystem II stability/assembly factor-like uncharacterized protein
MRKLILTFISLVNFSSFCISQSGWIRQDSLAIYSLRGIDIVNNCGMICGTINYVLVTTNNGNNWTSVATPSTTSSGLGVQMLNNQTAFVYNYGYDLYKTTNLGQNWINSFHSSTEFPLRIQMLNSTTGFFGTTNYAMLSHLYKTTNSGMNWTEICTFNTSSGFNVFYPISMDTLYEATNSVLKSVNGGINWSTIWFPYHSLWINDMTFVNNNSTGFCVGFDYPSGRYIPSVIYSTNSGLNWSIVNIPNTSSSSYIGLNSIDFYDNNNGFSVGDSGLIVRTTNQGKTWIKQSKLFQNFNDVAMTGVNSAITVGEKGVIYRTTNGGWDLPLAPTLLSPPNGSVSLPLNPIFDWSAVDYNAAIYRLQISTDSNFNTFVFNANNIDTSGYVFQGLLNVNTTYYWRVRAENPAYVSPWSSVWKFNTFVPIAPTLIVPVNNDTSVIPTQLMDWSYVNTSISYRAQISTDSNFNQIIIDTLTGVTSQFNVTYGKFISGSYYFWRARANNNSGTGPWSIIWKFRTTTIRPILLLPVSGDSGITTGTLFDWTNFQGANTYTIIISNNPNFTSSVYSNSYLSTSQWIMSSIYLSQNSIYYWKVNAKYGTNTSFWSDVWNFKTSRIFKVEMLSDIIPKEYCLYSNYPNPFNPSTKIKFDIPSKVKSQTSGYPSLWENVKLVIYDVLGHEVATLVNENLKPGTYEVEWDGSNLASGVYYYQLKTDEFTDTKRMILLK